MKNILVVAMALALAGCASFGRPVERTCWHASAEIEKEIGYCAAVRIGNTLHISGVTARGPMSDAVKRVYKYLGETLSVHGLTFADVVKETVYATDLDAFIQNKDLRKEFYGTTLPAATWVQVDRLYLPQLVVEVELTAQFPE